MIDDGVGNCTVSILYVDINSGCSHCCLWRSGNNDWCGYPGLHCSAFPSRTIKNISSAPVPLGQGGCWSSLADGISVLIYPTRCSTAWFHCEGWAFDISRSHLGLRPFQAFGWWFHGTVASQQESCVEDYGRRELGSLQVYRVCTADSFARNHDIGKDRTSQGTAAPLQCDKYRASLATL